MKVYTDTYLPYDFDSRRDVYELIKQRAGNVKKTIVLMDMNKEHLILMCPLSDSILKVEGTEEDVYWVHCQLAQNNWYTKNAD